MDFSRKYLLWLIVPPAIITTPLAFIFLSQLLHLPASQWLVVAGILVAVYAAGTFIFYTTLGPAARKVENALAKNRDLSEAMSECLERTVSTSAAVWIGGGVCFALLACWSVFPTFRGFTYFLVTALIAASLSIVWSYAAGKRLLLQTSGKSFVRYVGRTFPLRRKLAMLFIGSLLISSVALVQLVSSRVSTTLENLAITNSSGLFDRAFEQARAARGGLKGEGLSKIRSTLPDDYSLFRVDPAGTVLASHSGTSTRDTLDSEEVASILELRNGNSSRFISPHVMRFQQLPDSSILVLSIPWTTYQPIPRQITYYTLVITFITILIFSIATLFLSRDITGPLIELQAVAEEMALGNFESQAHIFSDDEVGSLGNSFATTRENLRQLISRIGGSGATITDGVKVITEGTDTLLTSAREQAELTQNSSAALGNVREGAHSILNAVEKVTEQTHDGSSRALELQASAEEVARSMEYLFSSVEKTSSSTTQMDAAAREMSQRTDVLANIGEEVLSFVTQMDATIEELHQTAQATASLSREVREDAAGGGSAVSDTVEGIRVSQESAKRTAAVLDDLQRSIGQISQILTVIEEITGRTNLLSLNAAIIAAQAGEQGASFTVVADEIRELADRTRGSTKEISGIIKAIQQASREAVRATHEGVDRVNQNVDLVNRASQSLSKIVSSASRSFEMATSISASLEQQSQSSRHLHQVASRMSDHIAEINRSTQEQARGTKLLAEEAERVREIALQVKNSTDQQTIAGRGISMAMEQIASDVRRIRDLLQHQSVETESIANASEMMLSIAKANDSVAQEFNQTVKNLLKSGRDFQSEVDRFKFTRS